MTTYYRTGLWFVKALREYTKNGYERAAKNFESLDGLSVEGRSFMITGANSGLGKELAFDLAKRGGTIHMVCRNETTGNEVKDEILAQTGNQNIHLHILDISEPRKVHEFGKQFAAENNPLHVLVNNAGAMVNAYTVTNEGLEKNFATNTFGTYMLTMSLVEHLKNFESPQIITVSSAGMLLVKLEIDDLQLEKMNPFDGSMAYSATKRQQIVMNDYWSEQYPTVQFQTMHPGWSDTPGVRTSLPDFHRRMENKFRTTAQGADTIIWLCVSPDARKQTSGQFYQDRKPVSKHLPLALTKTPDEIEKHFMEKLEKMASEFVTEST